MARILLFIVLGLLLSRAISRLVDGVRRGLSDPQSGSASRTSAVQMRRDPVCGTFVVPSSAVVLVERGRPVYFCGTACRDRYQTSDKRDFRTA